MRLQVRVIRVAETAMLTVDSGNIENVRADIMETAKKFPETLDFKKPKKGDNLIVQIDQIG